MPSVAGSIARFVERNLPEDPATRRPVINVFQQMGAANSATSNADGGDRAPKAEDEDGSESRPNVAPRVRRGLKRLVLRIVIVETLLFVALVAWWWGKLVFME